ncbi:hypothetical protein F750_2526 [Streptomyces sp. PAMC 26508]|nr:hypothetical protein F750_2526 [Streptomyces sp. PAMC 26508]
MPPPGSRVLHDSTLNGTARGPGCPRAEVHGIPGRYVRSSPYSACGTPGLTKRGHTCTSTGRRPPGSRWRCRFPTGPQAPEPRGR